MAGNGFNAFDCAAELEEKGMSRELAETLARTLTQVHDSTSATTQDLEVAKLELKRDIELVKRNIENVRAELKRDIELVKRDIENVRAELKRDIELVKRDIEIAKRDLKIWMGSIGAAGLSALVVLAKMGVLSIK